MPIPFDRYVRDRRASIAAHICNFFHPIFRELVEEVDGKRRQSFHGNIHHQSIRFREDGQIDAEYFNRGKRAPGSPPSQDMMLAYLAPEIERGEEDIRSDCYSVGALLFHIVRGAPPPAASYRVAGSELLRKEDHPDWHPAIVEAANRLLAMDPAQRFPDVEALWEKLADACVPELQPAHHDTPAPNARVVVAEAPEHASSLMPSAEPAIPSPPLEIHVSTASSTPAKAPPAPRGETRGKSIFTAVPPAPRPVLKPKPKPIETVEIRDRLPNASVGKPYDHDVRQLFSNPAQAIGIQVLAPENTGLTFDAETMRLHGTPTVAGEHPITLTYQRADGTKTERGVGLTINPDPTSLWKNQPSDANGIFAKPDADQGFLKTPDLTLLAASLRGRSHAHEGKYRDDDFAMDYLAKTGWHIIVVSDGAGSAKYSRRGAQIACQTAMSVMTAALESANPLDDHLAQAGAEPSEEEVEKLRKLSYNLLNPAA